MKTLLTEFGNLQDWRVVASKKFFALDQKAACMHEMEMWLALKLVGKDNNILQNAKRAFSLTRKVCSKAKYKASAKEKSIEG